MDLANARVCSWESKRGKAYENVDHRFGNMLKEDSVKSQRHHWWPETLSEFWKDPEDGFTGWLRPDGSVKRLPPKNLGAITNGHAVKWGKEPDDRTGCDASFETEFDRADSHFPGVLAWLKSLDRTDQPDAAKPVRFLAVQSNDAEISRLMECLVSLVVRSPVTREAAVALAEGLRGPLPERERNTLISANLWHLQRRFVDSLGTHGKFVAIYSPQREFIFGDGFFNNFGSMSAPHDPKIFLPLTPETAVLYTRPIRYIEEPRVTTLTIDAGEADVLNCAVQVYGKEHIFFRREQPSVSDCFRRAEHQKFTSTDNPIDQLIESIPGVPARRREFTWHMS